MVGLVRMFKGSWTQGIRAHSSFTPTHDMASVSSLDYRIASILARAPDLTCGRTFALAFAGIGRRHRDHAIPRWAYVAVLATQMSAWASFSQVCALLTRIFSAKMIVGS